MNLRVVTPVTADAAGADTVAEIVRAELLALRVAARHLLADRIVARLAPIGGVTREQVLAVIGRLEEVDDVTSGPGGRLAAAPVRVVRLSAGRYFVLGTVPTSHLLSQVPALDLIAGLLRRGRAAEAGEEELAAQVERIGGRVLDVARWAGPAPRADDAWLAGLDLRIGDMHFVDADSPIWSAPDWQRYVPKADAPQHHRWRRTGAEAAAGLIRARQPGGYHAYAWASTDRSGKPQLLALRRDEARRTLFALDAAAGATVTLRATKQGDAVVLTADMALPRAEYRSLLASGERLGGDGYPIRYRIAAADFAGVSARLRESLQVHVAMDEAQG